VRRKDLAGPGREPPVLLVKWYDLTRWILEKVDSFPKSQRFIFGTRLADQAIDVLETLVEASYSREKAELLAAANRKVETLRSSRASPTTRATMPSRISWSMLGKYLRTSHFSAYS
jgi:hypothetical protein